MPRTIATIDKEKFKELLNAGGITANRFGHLTGYHPQNVYNYTTGKTNVPSRAANFALLLAYLGPDNYEKIIAMMKKKFEICFDMEYSNRYE